MQGKISIDSDYVVFPSPPVDIVHILEADACGLAVNRLCPVSLFSVLFLIHSFSTKKKKGKIFCLHIVFGYAIWSAFDR